MSKVLPAFMLMGVSKEEFMESDPKELEPYVELQKMKQMKKDEEMWQMGIYVMNATYVAVSNSLLGRKSKAKYMEESILRKEEKKKEEAQKEEYMTEEQKKEGRKKFLMMLQLMQANFELNHENQGE